MIKSRTKINKNNKTDNKTRYRIKKASKRR